MRQAGTIQKTAAPRLAAFALVLVAALAAATTSLALAPAPAFAADDRVYIEATYRYDLASEELDLLNDERAGEGLDALVMDEDLQEAAMTRAVELSLNFSNTRPDGSLVSSLCSSALAENCAYGYSTAEEATQLFLVTESCREFMMSSDFAAVGVGCVEVGGTSYWVQVFGASGTEGYAGTGSTTELCPISIDYSVVPFDDSGFNLDDDLDEVQAIAPGGSFQLQVEIPNASWDGLFAPLDPYSFTWESSDEDVLEVDDEGVVTSVGMGTATITATSRGGWTWTQDFQVNFTDVTNVESWYYDEVTEMALDGYITGYDDGSFGVGDQMTRGQFVTILWRIACPREYASYEGDALNESGLSDVKDEAYYTAAINWAVENGVVTGYDNGEFGVNDSMTFQDMCLIIARYAGADDGSYDALTYAQGSEILAGFGDGSEVSRYAEPGVVWCVQEGLVSGNDDGVSDPTLSPKEEVARERVATVLYRALEEGVL